MITLITGAPGTGKSNALVSLLAELGKDRPLYVNGIPELKIPHVELEKLADWPTDVPDGACIVGDECQGTFRPRGPGQKVPEHVALLETHRHRGLDFYLITQGPNLVDTNVRALVGRHVHLRDLGLLGRWWYEWPECADNCRTAWKNAPIKKRYKLDKAAQAKYKSASIHVKPIRSVPWMLAVMVLALIAVGVTAWKTYSMIQDKMHPQLASAVKAPGATAPGQVQPGTTAPGATQSKLIDDRIDWVPRVSSRPESAPAFDEVRKVVAMPTVVGCVQFNGKARCFTQQGTDAGLSHSEAREWLAQPRFDPYRAPTAQTDPKGSERPKDAPTVSEPSFTLIDNARPASAAGPRPNAAASEAPRRPLADGHSALANPM